MVVSIRKTAKPEPMVNIDAMNSQAISVPRRVRTRLAANSRTTTRQVRIAEVTDNPVAQLISDIRRSSTLRSAIQRSCSWPRLTSTSDPTSRERSTIRDSLAARTLRNAPMPLSRKTGASASRTISATVLTERSGDDSNMPPYAPGTGSDSSPLSGWRTFAVGDFQQQRPVDDEARRQDPGTAREQLRRRPEDADHQCRDRKARDQQD